MTIEILPARLANQIAAGEVVERPASVVKELVENSLDAGATALKIDIEKGGAKRIRISDNGSGIAKEELALALSRHATSKIKNLKDLEGICSLGFRGEALASISSVARLTLASKPKEQERAWQASAQGRDMEVTIEPAAHPDGTTIDVVDLFFNTPARRKFMRTEKTEFSHIEEVIKRIALARFDVGIVLTHNAKIIRQYRVATTTAQKARRVAQVCGQAFIDNALEVECQHEGLTFHGWLAKPCFSRNQNDLCYSYVNGRMMRDKLINHAIRQSYHEMLPINTYPAFVLFLTLDVREVDVNVHPAKHEVRFHQGRYIHDFIYSVCNRALIENVENTSHHDEQVSISSAVNYQQQQDSAVAQAQEQIQDYVAPLKSVDYRDNQSSSNGTFSSGRQGGLSAQANPISAVASQAYQSLMTPHIEPKTNDNEVVQNDYSEQALSPLQYVEPNYALYFEHNKPRLIALSWLEEVIELSHIIKQWDKGLTSQPLLLPIKLQLPSEDMAFIFKYLSEFEKLGIVVQQINQSSLQIREYPALLRNQDVNNSFNLLLSSIKDAACKAQTTDDTLQVVDWQQSIVSLLVTHKMAEKNYDQDIVAELYRQLLVLYPTTIKNELALNSSTIDLTSAIEQLK